MKKFFNLHCKEEENALKEKMIELSNIPLKYVNFLEMYVSDDEFMHVTIIDDLTISNKKDIVLIHGLAASSLQYFKLFKRLSQNFRIFAIDLPGMGL
jgi:pimeloyl-ACP methyl ester carboxylesterase